MGFRGRCQALFLSATQKKRLTTQRKRSGRSAILCVFTHNNGREAQKNQSHRRVALGRRKLS